MLIGQIQAAFSARKSKPKRLKPLRVSVKVDWRRPAGMPEDIRLTRKDVARTRRVIWDWIRKHPSENLRALMDLTCLKIVIVPGLTGSKGEELGGYSPFRNIVQLSPVTFSEISHKPIRQTKRSLQDTLAHEIEGHMLDHSLDTFFGRVKRLPKQQFKHFMERHPKLEKLLKALYQPQKAHDDLFSYLPECLATYKEERRAVPRSVKKELGKDWGYFSDLEELWAYQAQFEARSRVIRGTSGSRKRKNRSKLTVNLRRSGSDEAAMMLREYFPKTLTIIQKLQDAILEI